MRTWIQGVLERNYRWPARKPSFTAAEMRNPVTRKSVYLNYANRYLAQAFPFGVPKNLITSLNGYRDLSQSPAPRPVSLFLRRVREAALLARLRARRVTQAVPFLQEERAGVQSEIALWRYRNERSDNIEME